jgi:multicomponent Na+:H+ antiporter subunit D
MNNFIPLLLIFIPIITAVLIYLFHYKVGYVLIYLSQALLAILIIRYYYFLNGVDFQHSIVIGGWSKQVGIELMNNRLSYSFLVLAIFMWWMIILYSFDKRRKDSRFYFFLLFLEGTFLGLIQSNDLFNLYVLLEISTIISTILIVYKKDGHSVRSGIFYLLFNSIGITFFLIGILLLYNITGTLNMSLIASQMDGIRGQVTTKFAFIFIMASACVKSALFPLFNWLPKAHGAAPTSISALLSGLIVKSGMYIFIRMNQLFVYEDFYDFFFVLGALTALIGVLFALSQKDLKQILAYHTISQMGIILMGISAFDQNDSIGGLLHIFNHALFKSILFLGVGIIIRHYHKRRVTEIRGVFKTLPLISIMLIIGMLAITGAPFFNGFVSKSIIKYGFKTSQIKGVIFSLINIGTATSFVKLSQIFFGKSDIKAANSHNENLPLFILALMIILLGNYYIPLGTGFFGVDLSYVSVLNLSNWINYLTTLGIGYLLYRYVIDKDPPFIKRLRHTLLTFETSNYLLITFIFSMVIWMFVIV